MQVWSRRGVELTGVELAGVELAGVELAGMQPAAGAGLLAEMRTPYGAQGMKVFC